jgi:hypothetical protein
MAYCGPLLPFGIAVILLMGLLVVVPYWRGKAELISGWNILLGGVALFIGIGAIEAAVSPMRFKGVQWFEPTREIVRWWTLATVGFIAAMIATHRFDPISRKLAARTFNKWPPITSGLLLFVVFFCVGLALMARVPIFTRIVGIGPLIVNVSHKAMIFACVFSFVLWYRNRLNLLWLGLFIFVLLSTAFLAILASGGRRLVLSVFLAPVLVFYFYQARHWRPTKALGVFTVAMLGVFCLSLIYSTIRHFDRRGEYAQQRDRSAGRAWEAVKGIGGTGWLEHFTGDMLWSLSQHVVHYGMLTDYYVGHGDLEAQPFNTFKFIAVYPIPRRIWPGKPESLGRVITNQMLGRKTTWGTGVQGHSAYEGGLLLAVMFGYMAAFGVRFFDDPLMRQPTNPFLIAMLSAAAMHIVAWPRGDLAVMTFEVAECFFFTLALSWVCRFLFGTDKSWILSRMAIGNGRVVYQAPAR